MNEYDVKRLALVLALQAEIEGMKVENAIRERQNYAYAYDEGDFQEMAEKLRNVACCHNDQL
jgi:hypothetical protein